MALALAAVFGSMSLANPAHAQAATTVDTVGVTIVGAVAADQMPTAQIAGTPIATTLRGGVNVGYNVTFTINGTDGYGAGDKITIEMPDFGTPGGESLATDVRISSNATGTSTILLGATDAVVWGDGKVTIDVPDFANYVGGATDPIYMNDDDVITVHFTKGANITTPEDLTTDGTDASDPPVQDTAKRVQWSVEGVDSSATDNATDTSAGSVVVVATYAEAVVAAGTFTPDDSDPGAGSLYTFDFPIDEEFNGGLYSLTIKLEEFGVPSSISTSSIAMEVTDPDANNDGTVDDEESFTFNPATVTVDGKEIIMTIPDVRPEADVTKKTFSENSMFKVLIYQSAGITNPTEANTYGGAEPNDDREIFATFGDSEVSRVNFSEMMVPRIVEIDPEDGGLGETVTATGKGFKNGTTLTVFLDRDRDGNLELGEDVLCVDPTISGDDIGECQFEVTHPTFRGGDVDLQMNYINAVDGRNGYVTKMDDGEFDLPMYELGASINATPKGGSPGEIILIQLLDFPKNAPITDVQIGRRSLNSNTYSATTDGTGAVNFPITIPNWVRGGVQELKVFAGGEDGSQNITLRGPQINVTPGTVLANQRISLVGTGFSPGAVIANDTDSLANSVDPVVSIGGKVIMGTRINDSDPVRVDNGGNWSASVDLPLAEATTAEGERAIRITDSRGRTGVALVDIPAREVTVTPEAGRVGTIAVVRGTGFPSKNDEGSSFNVQIVYDASNGNTTTVSALPDASGRFETQLRIPTTAAIPSSNSIKVSFRDEGGVDVVTTVAHDVPEGIITLSSTSGGPGSDVTVNGEGFKSFVPISLVKIGTLDVTPAPKPSTDGNGMMEFGITIPGLDVGIQTIEVHVGRTTASTGFTVTESGLNPGDIRPVAEGLEELGDNLDVIWHFNNDTKDWTFYDGQDGSTLTHVITGETYLILVKSNVEVILNRDTRSLTCVGGNCWNQIVW